MKKIISMIKYFVIALFVAGCSMHDYNLNKSIFIEDKSNPGLPIYSEWGYNTFGVYVDRVPVISEQFSIPTKIFVRNDTLYMACYGIKSMQKYTLTFGIQGYNPKSFDELIVLHDKTFDLSQHKCIVTLDDGNTIKTLSIFRGELKFIRVQQLYLDKKLNKSVLSGEFYFQTIINSQPVSFTSGRFDLGVGYDNFFYF